MNEKYCEIILKNDIAVSVDGATDEKLSIEERIEEDKKYGIFKPRNGKYFTYKVHGEDVEITHKRVIKAVQFGFKRWSIYADFRVKKARRNDIPDFNIYFKTPSEDPLLNKNTIMYHYYPINDLNNPLRGKCVINKNFTYTASGKITNGKRTMDIDQIICHEFGHGFGLPHDKEFRTIMYYSEGGMSEYPSSRDISRIQAKMGKTKKSSWIIKRWLRWLFNRSERY